MAPLMNDVQAAIVQRNKTRLEGLEEREKEQLAERGIAPSENGTPAESPKHKRRRKTLDEMSPAEIEAFRQRKMREEEARVLGKPVNAPKKRRRRRKHEAETPVEKPVKTKQKRAAKKTINPGNPVEQVEKQLVHKSRSPKTPKMLQPLTPLYLLKIPGLPEGDCLAICYVKGAS